MKSTPESVVHIRASAPGHTYIGASVCADEPDIRDLLELVNPLLVMDINQARSNVQSGRSVNDTLEHLDLTPAYERLLHGCLGRIASGKCAAYPRNP